MASYIIATISVFYIILLVGKLLQHNSVGIEDFFMRLQSIAETIGGVFYIFNTNPYDPFKLRYLPRVGLFNHFNTVFKDCLGRERPHIAVQGLDLELHVPSIP